MMRFLVMWGTEDDVVFGSQSLRDAKLYVAIRVHEKGMGAEEFVIIDDPGNRTWTLDPFTDMWEEG